MLTSDNTFTGAPTALPHWRAFFNPLVQRTFYHNELTGQSLWDLPRFDAAPPGSGASRPGGLENAIPNGNANRSDQGSHSLKSAQNSGRHRRRSRSRSRSRGRRAGSRSRNWQQPQTAGARPSASVSTVTASVAPVSNPIAVQSMPSSSTSSQIATCVQLTQSVEQSARGSMTPSDTSRSVATVTPTTPSSGQQDVLDANPGGMPGSSVWFQSEAQWSTPSFQDHIAAMRVNYGTHFERFDFRDYDDTLLERLQRGHCRRLGQYANDRSTPLHVKSLINAVREGDFLDTQVPDAPFASVELFEKARQSYLLLLLHLFAAPALHLKMLTVEACEATCMRSLAAVNTRYDHMSESERHKLSNFVRTVVGHLDRTSVVTP